MNCKWQNHVPLFPDLIKPLKISHRISGLIHLTIREEEGGGWAEVKYGILIGRCSALSIRQQKMAGHN